jgi:ribosomal protein S18 acetylase RimI-like enzyme
VFFNPETLVKVIRDAKIKMNVLLRSVNEGDNEFLYRVYASTREEELKPAGWGAEQLESFLRMQFAAQDTHYRAHYPDAEFLVISEGEIPAGRLYLYRHPKELRIMDIALLPEHRSKGIGSYLLRNLQQQAKKIGQALTIHVEKENPALNLYHRLGFEAAEDRGVYLFMKWISEN